MEKLIYEYCIIRFVPDIERGEFINIGLLMMCKRRKWLRCAMNIDEKKITALCAACDIERLKKQAEIFTSDKVPFPDIPVEEKYRWLAAVKSAMIQTSPSHPGVIACDTEDAIRRLESKFDCLFQRLV